MMMLMWSLVMIAASFVIHVRLSQFIFTLSTSQDVTQKLWHKGYIYEEQFRLRFLEHSISLETGVFISVSVSTGKITLVTETFLGIPNPMEPSKVSPCPFVFNK